MRLSVISRIIKEEVGLFDRLRYLNYYTLFQKCFCCCWHQHIIRRRDIIITESQELFVDVPSKLQIRIIFCRSLANQNGDRTRNE